MVVTNKSKVMRRLIWMAYAKWPGFEPLCMGVVWGSDKQAARRQAELIWPQVPSWTILHH